MNMKIENNEKELNEFLEYIQLDPEFIIIRTYANSVIVYFDRTIITNVFKKLIDLELDFFVYRSIYISFDWQRNDPCICLFIYKKKDYVFS
jgi:hypothetical protein